MPAPIRTLAFLGAVICSFPGFLAIQAYAQTPPDVTPPTLSDSATTPDTPPASTTTPTHHTKHLTTHHKKKTHHVSKKHKAAKTVKKSSGNTQLREAQKHLANLDYYKGKVDGINGPKTRAAIKKFQHDHKLHATGKLTQQTYDAIIAADKENTMSSEPLGLHNEKAPPGAAPEPLNAENVPVPPDFYATHPDFYGYYDQSFDNPLLLGESQTLYSRFAKIDLTQDSDQGGMKRYNIMLNGLPLILVDGQAAVIGVSHTFAMGDEDVMIFTSYKDRDPVCAYAYNLLILSADGTQSRSIQNCTRGYQAKIANGSLFITFPENGTDRAVGNTWRYEKGDLEKL